MYRNVPFNTGRTVLLSQCLVRDEINEWLIGYIGSEQEQQVFGLVAIGMYSIEGLLLKIEAPGLLQCIAPTCNILM